MAAGLGFKTFTTGEVLTAADTNGYLMQGVLVFASSAARASAITSPQEGQYSYLKDTDALEYYSGSAWVGAPVGDITGVTAGTGISGGGTSGTVTVTNDMATTITTAGDLIKGTGAGTYSRLGIGTTSQVLTVVAGAPAWATPAGGGGMTVLASGSVAASTTGFSLTSISGSYKSLQLVIRNSYCAGDSNSQIRLNNDTTSIYNSILQYGTSTSTYNTQFIGDNSKWYCDSNNSSKVANTSMIVINIPDYAGDAFKVGSGNVVNQDRATGAYGTYLLGFAYKSTTAITRIDFISGSGAFVAAGTYTLYGVN